MVMVYDRLFMFPELLRRPRWRLYCGLAATGLILPVVWLFNGPDGVASSAGFGLSAITPFTYALSQPAVILHYHAARIFSAETGLKWDPFKIEPLLDWWANNQGKFFDSE